MEVMRKRNRRWAANHNQREHGSWGLKRDTRRQDFFKVVADQLNLTITEAWRLYEARKATGTISELDLLLGRVQKGLELRQELFEYMPPDLMDLTGRPEDDAEIRVEDLKPVKKTLARQRSKR